MKKNKLLIVTTTSLTISTILKHQPKHLNKKLDVFIATSKDDTFEDIKKNEGLTPHNIPMYRGINPFYDIYSIFCMVKLILKIKPDIVHSYTPKAGLITMLSAFICRVPIRIHTFTGLIFPSISGLKKNIIISIDRLICFCATKIVPEGEGVKSELIKYKVTRKDLHVIGNGNIAGIDTGYYCTDLPEVRESSDKLRRRLNLPKNIFTFIFVGRLNKDKGVDELISAFNMLDKKRCHLLIVGPIDTHGAIADKTIFNIKNSTSITWLGFQKDIRASLAVSNALVLPSYREGFPNVLIQAGAMDLPSISTAVSGANEILKENETGFIIPIRDVESLYLKMEYLMSIEEEELKEIGREARKRVKTLFEKTDYLIKLEELYTNEIMYKKII
jgi:glycosyltransferase involved in cell wall biosynthesis